MSVEDGLDFGEAGFGVGSACQGGLGSRWGYGGCVVDRGATGEPDAYAEERREDNDGRTLHGALGPMPTSGPSAPCDERPTGLYTPK